MRGILNIFYVCMTLSLFFFFAPSFYIYNYFHFLMFWIFGRVNPKIDFLSGNLVYVISFLFLFFFFFFLSLKEKRFTRLPIGAQQQTDFFFFFFLLPRNISPSDLSYPLPLEFAFLMICHRFYPKTGKQLECPQGNYCPDPETMVPFFFFSFFSFLLLNSFYEK
jgi:hypothetical protein